MRMRWILTWKIVEDSGDIKYDNDLTVDWNAEPVRKAKARLVLLGYTADDLLERSYIPAFASCDGDDLLAQIHAWREADAGSLSKVRAKVLLMPCDNDKYFTVEEARREAAMLGGRCTLRPIVSEAGHRAGDPHRKELMEEAAFLKQQVREALMREK